jgi:hypothetical protein
MFLWTKDTASVQLSKYGTGIVLYTAAIALRNFEKSAGGKQALKIDTFHWLQSFW